MLTEQHILFAMYQQNLVLLFSRSGAVRRHGRSEIVNDTYGFRDIKACSAARLRTSSAYSRTIDPLCLLFAGIKSIMLDREPPRLPQALYFSTAISTREQFLDMINLFLDDNNISLIGPSKIEIQQTEDAGMHVSKPFLSLICELT